MEIFKAKDRSQLRPRGAIAITLESNFSHEVQEAQFSDTVSTCEGHEQGYEVSTAVVLSPRVTEPGADAIVVVSYTPALSDSSEFSLPDPYPIPSGPLQTQTVSGTFSLKVTGTANKICNRIFG